MTASDVIDDPQTYAIIGAAIEVHRMLGVGFLEAVYQEALQLRLDSHGIPFRANVPIPIFFMGRKLKARYRADLVCYDEIVVELKVVRALTGIDQAQLLNYLRASALRRGLLLNFGTTIVEKKRLLL